MQPDTSYAFDTGRRPPDGRPIAVMDWPELGSPVPRLSLSINEGLMLIRINEAMRQLY